MREVALILIVGLDGGISKVFIAKEFIANYTKFFLQCFRGRANPLVGEGV